MIRSQKLVLSIALSVCLLVGSCGGSDALTGFKVAFASARPFIQNSLVQSGVISQQKADLAVADIEDGLGDATKAQQCVSAITVSGKAKTVAKAKCYYELAEGLRSVLARHNLGGVKQLDAIATIAEGAIAAFESYYASVNGTAKAAPAGALRSNSVAGTPISEGDADKQLENSLKALNEQLKTVTGS